MESHRWVKTSLRLAPSAIISSVRLSAVRSDSACIQSSVSAPVLSVLKIPPNPIPCPAPCVDAARPSTGGNRAYFRPSTPFTVRLARTLGSFPYALLVGLPSQQTSSYKVGNPKYSAKSRATIPRQAKLFDQPDESAIDTPV